MAQRQTLVVVTKRFLPLRDGRPDRRVAVSLAKAPDKQILEFEGQMAPNPVTGTGGQLAVSALAQGTGTQHEVLHRIVPIAVAVWGITQIEDIE